MKRAHFADVEDGRCEQASHEAAAATSLSESFSYGGEFSPTHPPSNRYAGISSSSLSLNHTKVPELSSLSPRHTLSESLLDLLPPPRTEIPPQSQPQPQQRQQQQNLSSQMLQQVPEEHSECLISEKGLSCEGHLSRDGDGAVVKSLDEFKSMDESVPAHVVIHIHPDTPESERNKIKAVTNIDRSVRNRQVMGL